MIDLSGLLLPDSFMDSKFYIALATLVGLNTVIYAALSLVHVIPHWIKASWFRRSRRRSETRSIYPDGPA